MAATSDWRMELATELAAYLARQVPVARGSVVWGKEGEERWPLDITGYLTQELPPLAYVTSMRAVVLRGGAVLAMEDDDGLHILPGARRERGEAIEETLRREVLEEAGWSLHIGPLLGVTHFRHTGPAPALAADSPYHYPYPDFLNLVYLAEAVTYDADLLLPNAFEQQPYRLQPLATLALERLDAGARAYLAAAVAAFRPGQGSTNRSAPAHL
jgi:ADP-ribose pyrophosphatase YjhB (NUDIX family)